jgi:hypothetical protein
MPSVIERILSILLLGMWPPVPYELRSDYVQGTADVQAELRRKYATRQLRWSRFMGGLAIMLLIKWAWEFGWLAFLGLGPGIATAADVEGLKGGQAETRQQLTAARVEQAQFVRRYDKDVLEAKLRSNEAEAYQVQNAINEARSNGRVPDQLHLSRLSTLNSEHGDLLRQLEALNRQ